MAEERAQRRLAAILAADVVGYSRMMQADEAGTLAALKSRRTEILQPLVAKYHGRIVKVMGDGVLVEFASAVEAVSCAVALQEAMVVANKGVQENRRIVLRIGINLGDVMVEGGDLYGDGVNIAARLEGIAGPGAVVVSDKVRGEVVGKLGLTFENLGAQSLKNIIEPVLAHQVRPSDIEIVADTAPTLPDKPSIAVLPFVNMSGDPEQEFFVDGLTEEIITVLSRVSAFWVIARTSAFTYKGKSADVKQVAKELGVRYVMEGSARRSGDRLRVTAQLIDADTGRHVWAERYDRPMDDVFEIQDDIVRGVASSTETHLYLAEGEAVKSKPIVDFGAGDLVAKAWARMWEEETPEGFAEASKLAEEAIRIDPLNPVAHRVRAIVFISRLWWGEIPHDASNTVRAMELAKTARRLAPRDEWAHLVMAWAHAHAGDAKLEEAVAECERGLEINPNNSSLLGNRGTFLAFLGRAKEGIEACRLALRLNPRSPDAPFWRNGIAIAHFVQENYEAALQESRNVDRSRVPLQSAIIQAVSTAALGKLDEARAAVEYCITRQPDLRVATVAPRFMLRFRRDEDHERICMLLRKAGLPE